MRTEQADRLRAELRVSSPNAHGVYMLDMSQYQEIPFEEVGRILHQEGWEPARNLPRQVRVEIPLTRPGDTAVPNHDRTFVQGAGPDILRANPRVSARAEEIRSCQGFDPLSREELNRVRERHQYWRKKFNRQVALASLYTILGGILGAFAASDEADWDSGSAYVLLAIPAIILLLACVSIYKSVRMWKARGAEIGDFLNAYEELVRLARLDSTSGLP